VTELDGTTPIIGATVTAKIVADEQGNPIVLPPGIPSTYTAKTGGDGTYRIEGLPNATYEVTASAPQHSSVTKTGVVVRPGLETTGVDFQLPGEPGTITGQVVDAATNQGIPNALVEVLSATMSSRRRRQMPKAISRSRMCPSALIRCGRRRPITSPTLSRAFKCRRQGR
jgi:hypothetical protein